MENAFVYFDPPYYVNGQRLYKNSFSATDHADIANCIIAGVDCPWVITYDAVSELKAIYANFPQICCTLNYSADNKGKGTEFIIFKAPQLIPTAVGQIKYLSRIASLPRSLSVLSARGSSLSRLLI